MTSSWRRAAESSAATPTTAVIAQATATAAVVLNGRFGFGGGAGEALNEHTLGLGAGTSGDARRRSAQCGFSYTHCFAPAAGRR